MPIAAAYMVPHPPMIVPEVGRGSEKQIEKTLKVRPELLSGAELSKKEKDFLEQLKNIK